MQFPVAGQYLFESQPVVRGTTQLAAELESQSRIRVVASTENTARCCSSHSLPQTRMSGQDWVCGYQKPSSRDTEEGFDSNPGPTLGNPERFSRSFCQAMRSQAQLKREGDALDTRLASRLPLHDHLVFSAPSKPRLLRLGWESTIVRAHSPRTTVPPPGMRSAAAVRCRAVHRKNLA